MTDEQLKARYDANPSEWVVVVTDKHDSPWEIYKQESKPELFVFDSEILIWKLIHIKHKEVLEAYLADDTVEIEFYLPYVMCTDDTELEATWEVDDNFIENYDPELEYRLKEKKDGTYTNNNISSATVRNDDSDSDTVNSFTAHGFETPDFEGEILKKVGDKFIGYGTYRNETPTACIWDKDGKRGSYKSFYLTPIKRPWHEDESNFPALVTRNGFFFVVDWSDYKVLYRNHRLATKSELMSLYCNED